MGKKRERLEARITELEARLQRLEDELAATRRDRGQGGASVARTRPRPIVVPIPDALSGAHQMA